jgi:hypothetical protein
MVFDNSKGNNPNKDSTPRPFYRVAVPSHAHKGRTNVTLGRMAAFSFMAACEVGRSKAQEPEDPDDFLARPTTSTKSGGVTGARRLVGGAERARPSRRQILKKSEIFHWIIRTASSR